MIDTTTTKKNARLIKKLNKDWKVWQKYVDFKCYNEGIGINICILALELISYNKSRY